MARILVTGGAGFIGSHTSERLLARGDQVVVLDNFNDAYDPAIKRANAAALKGARIGTGAIPTRDLVPHPRPFSPPDASPHLTR